MGTTTFVAALSSTRDNLYHDTLPLRRPLRIKVPVMRFESPELEGPEKQNFNFAAGAQSYNEAELSPGARRT